MCPIIVQGPLYKRGDKIYLDSEEKEESVVNQFLECRDGIIQCVNYMDDSGYGSKTRLLLCHNTKHEVSAIIRQTYSRLSNKWAEESMFFDSDSFEYLEKLLGKQDFSAGRFEVWRDYMMEQGHKINPD